MMEEEQLTTLLGMEKVRKRVVSDLQWNDLLRLRRVSTSVKVVADEILRSGAKENTSEIEINDTDKSCNSFLQLGFALKRVFFNNRISGNNFYRSHKFEEFVTKYAPGLSHFRISQVSGNPVYEERLLFDSLCASLTHLDVGSPRRGNPTLGCFPLRMPALKSLRIRSGFSNPKETDMKWIAGLALIALTAYPSLEHLVLPSILCSFQLAGGSPVAGGKPDWFMSIIQTIKKRGIQALVEPGALLKLRILEFDDTHRDAFTTDIDEFSSSPGRRNALENFIQLARQCVKQGIQLKNFNSAYFNRFVEGISGQPDVDLLIKVGENVKSMLNLHIAAVRMEMPNLEELIIDKTSQSSVSISPCGRPDWPNLKSLSFRADRKILLLLMPWDVTYQSPECNAIMIMPVCRLYEFLFKGPAYQNLVELKMNFLSESGEISDIPEADSIVNSCQNLKKLTVEHWPGEGLELLTLWQGLMHLEELSLVNCFEIGERSFLGCDDTKTPPFLQMTKLRKLTIKGLHKTPGINDKIFNLVFRHMPLQEFYLHGDKVLKTITINAIRYLLEGTFATTIEKFPFNTFQIKHNTRSASEFIKLQNKFRSFQLL